MADFSKVKLKAGSMGYKLMTTLSGKSELALADMYASLWPGETPNESYFNRLRFLIHQVNRQILLATGRKSVIKLTRAKVFLT